MYPLESIITPLPRPSRTYSLSSKPGNLKPPPQGSKPNGDGIVWNPGTTALTTLREVIVTTEGPAEDAISQNAALSASGSATETSTRTVST